MDASGSDGISGVLRLKELFEQNKIITDSLKNFEKRLKILEEKVDSICPMGPDDKPYYKGKHDYHAYHPKLSDMGLC